MTILVTGAAGFIGFHVCKALLEQGETVVGVDNLNDYYDVALKEARLALLDKVPGAADRWTFSKTDIADLDAMRRVVEGRGVDRVVHLAAQAGVRHSISAPFDYVHSNLVGHMVILELCRSLMPALRSFVYASSSSVYGGSSEVPFSEAHTVDRPVSLYAATKRSNEILTHSYAHLYAIPAIGLRFFTVYGPWGRPDMALFTFARQMLAGEPIRIFNHGDMRRDFTYIDDIVDGVLAALRSPPSANDPAEEPPHRVLNLGGSTPQPLMHVVELLEKNLGIKALKKMEGMQPGDVKETYADISLSEERLGFSPKVGIEEGVGRFVAWYKDYYGLQ